MFITLSAHLFLYLLIYFYFILIIFFFLLNIVSWSYDFQI